ncbi:hypothetical protein [Terriglobus sp. RCC_193]|uniref:hypothetical protein n=1 Tax=Terriglobus sp. RCC_193 TaxID=3239218 RepID=UPI00352679EF
MRVFRHALPLLLLAVASSVGAQITKFVAYNVVAPDGQTKLKSGTVTITPEDINQQPANYKLGVAGGGVVTRQPVTGVVVNGQVFARVGSTLTDGMNVADGCLATPTIIKYHVVIKDVTATASQPYAVDAHKVPICGTSWSLDAWSFDDTDTGSGATSVTHADTASHADSADYATDTTARNLASTAQTAADGKVARTGDSMTGALNLYGNPTANLQAAPKQYVDQAAANATDSTARSAASTAQTAADGKVARTGDSMTGALNLYGNPTANLQAAPKQYVDQAVANAGGNPGGSTCNMQFKGADGKFGGDTGTCTDGAGNVTLSSLTGKFVSSLGMAKQWRSTSTSTDGCQRAFAGGALNCVIEPGYTNDAGIVATSANPVVHTIDNSYAGTAEVIQNAQLYGISTQPQWAKRYLYYSNDKMTQVNAGAYNQRPLGQQEFFYFSNRGRDENSGSGISQWQVGVGKNTYMQSNGAGIRQHETTNTNCYGIGDCMWHYGYMVYSGGNPDGSAEGYRAWAHHVTEQSFAVLGTTSSVINQTSVRANLTQGGGTQGVGRMLVDKKTALYTGNITAAVYDATYGLTKVTVDTTLTPSPWIGQGATSVNPPVSLDSPATVAITLTTAFSSDSSGLANGDHMCVASTNSSGGEEVIISGLSVAGTSVTFSAPFRRGHLGNTTAAKGACTALDASQLRLGNSTGPMNAQMVVGISDSHTLLTGNWFLGAAQGLYASFLNGPNHACAANISQSGTTVTALTSIASCAVYLANNPAVVVSGTTDFNGVPPNAPVYNGNIGSNAVTWTAAGSATIGSEAGTITTTNTSSAYNIWPMALIYNVCDPGVTTAPSIGSTSSQNPCVNGYMDLETNNVAWAASDPLEIPHFNAQRANGGLFNLQQYTQGSGQIMSGLTINMAGEGWGFAPALDITTGDANYLGTGGRMSTPPIGIQFRGPNVNTIRTNAPTIPAVGSTAAVMLVNCMTVGTYASNYNCAKTPEYNFAYMAGVSGNGAITFDPQTNTVGLGGGAIKIRRGPLNLWAVNTGTGIVQQPLVGNLFFDISTNHIKAANNSATFADLAFLNEVCLPSATCTGYQASLGYTPVNRAGDTMTGALVLPADPTAALQAATKQYVDSHTASSIPAGTGLVRQSGTTTSVSALSTSDVNAVGTISNSTSGNAATATALAAIPSQCGTNQYSKGITANGNASCSNFSSGPAATSTGDVSSSRAFGTVYQNTNSYPIFVSGWAQTTGSAWIAFFCNAGPTSTPAYPIWANQVGATTEAQPAGFSCMIQPGWYYTISANTSTPGTAALSNLHWYETSMQ